MATTELLIVSNTAGLSDALQGYEGLQVFSAPSLTRVKSLLASVQPPQAIYIEDSRGTLPELWEVIRAAQAAHVPVLVGLVTYGRAHMGDFQDAGIPVTDAREATTLAGWIGQQLGARQRAASAGHVTIAVAGAKGGIGKTLLVALLAEGLKQRGLRVLVVDGDLSNSGLVPTFRIPSGFPSYLYLKADGLAAFTPENMRRHIYHHSSGIDFLLGSEETASPVDMTLNEWQAMMMAIRRMDGYDVVLLDTGPELKKRPYAIDAARNGGFVVLPTPPGRKERAGVGNALRAFEQHTPDLTDRCLLAYMEPEKGVTVSLNHVAPLFAQNWPSARAIGVLPRAPRQVSMADEEGDKYLSPLDVAPHSKFSRAVHELVNELCVQTGLRPPREMPKSTFWQALRGERPNLVPTASVAVGGTEVRA
jgi:MinD-like ATPase involved in chromosome partitioning or flagellar assembly